MRGPLLTTFTLITLSTASVHAADLRPRAMAKDSASATAGVSPRMLKPPPPPSVSEEEARAWLARYETAWSDHDVAALSELGIIRADQQDEARRQLAAYKQYEVSVSNESISLEATKARMSFDRVDKDETGRRMKHPRQTVVLEHLPQGVVSTWRNRADK
jgi:hypothetical protein